MQDLLLNNQYFMNFDYEDENFYITYNNDTGYILLNNQEQRLDKYDYNSEWKYGKNLLEKEVKKEALFLKDTNYEIQQDTQNKKLITLTINNVSNINEDTIEELRLQAYHLKFDFNGLHKEDSNKYTFNFIYQEVTIFENRTFKFATRIKKLVENCVDIINNKVFNINNKNKIKVTNLIDRSDLYNLYCYEITDINNEKYYVVLGEDRIEDYLEDITSNNIPMFKDKERAISLYNNLFKDSIEHYLQLEITKQLKLSTITKINNKSYAIRNNMFLIDLDIDFDNYGVELTDHIELLDEKVLSNELVSNLSKLNYSPKYYLIERIKRNIQDHKIIFEKVIERDKFEKVFEAHIVDMLNDLYEEYKDDPEYKDRMFLKYDSYDNAYEVYICNITKDKFRKYAFEKYISRTY